MTERALGILKLFSLEKPTWSAEEIASATETSVSTAYRSIAVLEAAGLITAARPRMYVLGPAIMQYDRQIQLTDPLLLAARPIMREIVAYAPTGSVMLLCRWFGETVVCVHQDGRQGSGPPLPVSYERGRPMPLFRGATSKIILAHLQPRLQRRLYDRHAEEIGSAGLGRDWPEFKSVLLQLRRTGFAVTHGEVDPGLVGISVPIVANENHTIGSLSYVVREDDADPRLLARLSGLLAAGAREVETVMKPGGAAER